MGPRFKVSSESLKKPGIEPTTPGLQREWLKQYTTEATRTAALKFQTNMYRVCTKISNTHIFSGKCVPKLNVYAN